MWENGLILSFVGTCRPRYGGTGTFGFVIGRGDRVLVDDCGFAACGRGSSIYMAAYTGLIAGLAALSRRGSFHPVEIRGDCDLVMAHMTGVKNCYSKHLRPHHRLAAWYVEHLVANVTWSPIARHENPALPLAESVWLDTGQILLAE